MKNTEIMKKVLSFMLILCMVLSYVPTTAFAVTAENTAPEGRQTIDDSISYDLWVDGCDLAVTLTASEAHTFDTILNKCVCGAVAVAKVGEHCYLTLPEAVAAAGNGDTITLLADVTIAESERVTIPERATLAFGEGVKLTNNGTLVLPGTEALSCLTADNYSGTGTVEAGYTTYILHEGSWYSEVNSSGGISIGTDTPATYYTCRDGYAIYDGSGTLTLYGATVTVTSGSVAYAVMSSSDLSIVMNGTSTLTAGAASGGAAISVNGTLTIRGDGSLTANGKMQSMIGDGGYLGTGIEAKSLTISGGTVTVTGGDQDISITGTAMPTVDKGATLYSSGTTIVGDKPYTWNGTKWICKDTIAPTGTVTLSTDSWSVFLNTITFGKYFKETQTVSVTAADNLSGIAKIEYYETKDILSLNDVKALEEAKWTVMNGGKVSVTAEDAKQFIFYIRITDNSGNVSYLATNGAEFDTTAPVIAGVENGKTYYSNKTVTVTDKYLETVTLDGTAVTGTITLEGNKDASHTIVATDKAGNTTTVTVTMAKIVDIGNSMDGLAEENVTSDHRETLEDIVDTAQALLKDGKLTTAEKQALEAAEEKAEALLEVLDDAAADIDTQNTQKVENITCENVKPEDKENLKKAKEDLEKALEENPGNYTNEEKQQIQQEIDRIDHAIETIEKVKDMTGKIEKLPDSVEPDDEESAEKILDIQKVYSDLTDYQKSLVDEITKGKLGDLVAALTAYDIIRGDGSKWTKGSITFIANGPFRKFTGIRVDGKEVDGKHYDATSGSTIITLKESLLKQLPVGEHTLTILYTDGETQGTFTIVRAADSNTLATGDDSDILLWSTLICVSTLGLAVIFADRKRRSTK